MICDRMPSRWIFCLMSMLGSMNFYSIRLNLSSAITAMVDYKALNRSGKYMPYVIERRDRQVGSRYVWDEDAQGLVLGCFSYGYIFSQVFGTWIGRKLGRVRTVGICILLASILTCLLPQLLQLNFAAFIVGRTAIGVLNGLYFPTLYGLIGVWSPPMERAKMVAISFTGVPLGSLAVLPLSGYLAQEHGWPSVFYVTGIISAIWSTLWLIFVFDSPADHPRISIKEKEYIQSSLEQNAVERKEARSVPWFSLLTSSAVWSIIVTHFLVHIPFYIIPSLLPTYLHTIENLSVQASSSFSAFPFVLHAIGLPLCGFIADWMISKGVKTIIARKLFTVTGSLIPAAAYVAISFIHGNTAITVLLFCFTSPLAQILHIPGYSASAVDMAPLYSGIIFAIANTFGSMPGFLTPQIAGVLIKGKDPRLGWQMLFWIAAACYIMGSIVYLIFGTSDVQKWAKPPENTDHEDIESETHSLLQTHDLPKRIKHVDQRRLQKVPYT